VTESLRVKEREIDRVYVRERVRDKERSVCGVCVRERCIFVFHSSHVSTDQKYLSGKSDFKLIEE